MKWFSIQRQPGSGFWMLEIRALRLAVLLSAWWGWGTNHSLLARQWIAGPLIITRLTRAFARACNRAENGLTG